MVKVILTWKYEVAKRPSATFSSDWLDAKVALVIVEDLEKAGRLKDSEFRDEMGMTWTKKELKKLLTVVEEEPQDITVYFDGGYQKSTQLTGLGIVIYYKQGSKEWRIRKNELIMELESNNEAEYAAFYEAVNQLEELDVHHQPVTFKGDSLVVLNQLSGEWPCFEDTLSVWLDRIEAKMKKLGIKPIYEPVVRNNNQEADKLATQALNGEKIFSKFNLK